MGLFWCKTDFDMVADTKEVLHLAALYLRIYFLGMTATMVYNFGSAILRAVGDTKRPLYYLFGAGVVNVILNLLFVIGFHLDVAGVAGNRDFTVHFRRSGASVSDQRKRSNPLRNQTASHS